MPNEIIVSTVELLHNQLCVKQDKPAEQHKSKVQLKLDERINK